MENIEKCLTIAVNELSKLSFSGAALVPAGKVMNALLLALEETRRLKAEEQDHAEEAKEERDNDGE